jgi:hypothetical protein
MNRINMEDIYEITSGKRNWEEEAVDKPIISEIKLSRVKSYNEDLINCGNIRFWYNGDNIEYVDFFALELDVEKFSYIFKMAFETSLKDINIKFIHKETQFIKNVTKRRYIERFKGVRFIPVERKDIEESEKPSMVLENFKIVQEGKKQWKD